jgi:hypothetical protein
MTTQSQLRDLEQRPQRYWNADGIPELVMGLVWVLWGVALLIGEALPQGQGQQAYWLVMPAILVLSGFGANWLVKQLKERLTYPRAGFVTYREPGRATRLLSAGVAVLAAATLAFLIVTGRQGGLEHAAAPAIGLVLSLAFLVAALRQRAPHYLALAGVALMLGLAFGALKLGWESLNWMLVWLGAAAASMGAWRLSRFLRLHERPEDTEHNP